MDVIAVDDVWMLPGGKPRNQRSFMFGKVPWMSVGLGAASNGSGQTGS